MANVRDAELLLAIGSSTPKPRKLHPKFRPVSPLVQKTKISPRFP
jgi:hypothetical protein